MKVKSRWVYLGTEAEGSQQGCKLTALMVMFKGTPILFPMAGF